MMCTNRDFQQSMLQVGVSRAMHASFVEVPTIRVVLHLLIYVFVSSIGGSRAYMACTEMLGYVRVNFIG